jgi:hypothetical protein
MKALLSLGIFMFSLSFCNLADGFLGKKNSNSGTNTPAKTTDAKGSPAKSEGEAAEKYTLTAEQSAILHGGKDMKWDEQGIGWTLPATWKKSSSSANNLMWSSPDGAFLIITISPMSDDFPMDVSLKANYDGAVTRQKNGELEKLRYLELDGIKGVEFIESMPEDKSGPRRQQWLAFRKYAGRNQMLNFMLSTKGSSFDKQRDTFAAIMSSSKITQ